MVAGLEPLVVFWTGWGIHFMVLVSFTVQVTLLLLADVRRRKDWVWLKVVIWSAYMLADTTAIYALGHMSVLCHWSPEHQLMALWAPLLLVHLGGQDNITAYAIEDNRLWLRHLQTFVLQVAAAGYVLYVSSIVSHPSKLRSAAILMFVVGVLKYGERIWALMRADSCCSSSLSATSYDRAVSVVSRTAAGGGDDHESSNKLARAINERNSHLIVAYSLLDVPKQMFEGPTTYVQFDKLGNMVRHEAEYMLRVVEMQLSMMYDLLYTKAAVVHTWYGLCSRVLISLPFTAAALALFRSVLSHSHDDKGDDADHKLGYRRVDVTITNVLLIGAVVLEIISVLRTIFSKWTAVLLYGKEWDTIGDMVFTVILVVTRAMGRLVRRGGALFVYKLSRHSDCICGTSCSNKLGETALVAPPLLDPWLGRMRQHSLFVLMSHHYNYSVGRKMAKWMRVEDWWDSNVYSTSTEVPKLVISKVLKLVSSKSTQEDITKSQGLNALLRHMNNEHLAAWIWWMEDDMNLEDRILVWHIATHVYTWLYRGRGGRAIWKVRRAAEVLADYMFFLLAARPYMLPYPVSRQAYAQLCTDAETHLRYCCLIKLHDAVLNQKDALMQGTPLQPDKGIGRRQTAAAAAAAQSPQPSMNKILDRGCQLAAKLIHITAKKTEQAEITVNGEDIITPEQAAETTFSMNGKDILNMVLEVWVEMLCYTAYLCNENSHAKHLTDGGEIMTFITLMMIYKKNGLFRKNTRTITSGTAAIFCSTRRHR